jgi:hypothetical protein
MLHDPNDPYAFRVEPDSVEGSEDGLLDGMCNATVRFSSGGSNNESDIASLMDTPMRESDIDDDATWSMVDTVSSSHTI